MKHLERKTKSNWGLSSENGNDVELDTAKIYAIDPAK